MLAAPSTLLGSQPFRRTLAWSAGAHLLTAMLAVLAPALRAPARAPDAVFVDLVTLPAPAPPPAAPRQVVEEPVVIPDEPKPEPEPPKPKPEPRPKEPEKPPAPSYDQVIAQLRASSPARTPTEETPPSRPGAPGRVDPELARYTRDLERRIRRGWAGAKAYRDRRDLEVHFEISVDGGGRVRTRLIRTSGVRTLDESAERAIAKLQPFPAPPRGYRTVIVRMSPAEL